MSSTNFSLVEEKCKIVGENCFFSSSSSFHNVFKILCLFSHRHFYWKNLFISCFCALSSLHINIMIYICAIRSKIQFSLGSNNSSNKSLNGFSFSLFLFSFTIQKNKLRHRLQASLSLDYSVETVLLKNECDFISVEQGKESTRKKQQRDENIRQLLDVTNKTMLTTEEMRDFEMKWVEICFCC